MKNNFEKIMEKAGAHITLTETERERMRFVLREYATLKPVQRPALAPRIDAWFAYLRRPVNVAIATVLILTLSSGGIAFAAERTLPGDVLYPVKVSVIEPLRIALAASPEAKASLQMAFAQRRIDEAAELASEGKLSTTTEISLAANFTENASNATITVVHERTQDPITATVLATGFAAQLTAYENVLAVVEKHSHGMGTTTHFQTAIQAQIASITGVQANDETQATSSIRASIQGRKMGDHQDIQHLQDAANEALNASADIISMASSTLDVSSSASARDEFARAAALTKRGRDLLEQHDESGAAEAFHASISATARLDVLTHAAAELQIPTFATTTVSTTTPTTPTIQTDESSSEDGAIQENQTLPLGL
ncbi:MAG: DUF5667 domain-containing protein [Minisyncoccota bacterium]